MKTAPINVGAVLYLLGLLVEKLGGDFFGDGLLLRGGLFGRYLFGRYLLGGSFFRLIFAQNGFLHEGVETGFLVGRGILFDDILFSCLVESLLRFFVEFLCIVKLSGCDRFTGFLDRAFHDTLYDLILFGLAGGDSHVFDGILLDWHSDARYN